MNSTRWQTRFALMLVAIAVALYALRFALFYSPDFHSEMWRFLVGDIAFLFVQVPLVTLVIDRVLQKRQREEMLTKLNMVIGSFFSEAGQRLLGLVAASDTDLGRVRADLVPTGSWTGADYAAAKSAFREHAPSIDLSACEIDALKTTLYEERAFLLGLLGNQNLLEHETFTDLLWALTHLGEELSARKDLDVMSEPDAVHLAGDIKRVYTLLGIEWLSYLQHLQAQYPYLFSLAVRTNPLDPSAHAEVTS